MFHVGLKRMVAEFLPGAGDPRGRGLSPGFRPWGVGACVTVAVDADCRRGPGPVGEVLQVLARHRLTVVFAVAAAWLEKYPEIHRDIAAAGHEVMNEAGGHPVRGLESAVAVRVANPAIFRGEILRGHRLIVDRLGVVPVSFRPAGAMDLPSGVLYDLLAGPGYRCVASTVAVADRHRGLYHPVRANLWEFPATACPRHPGAAWGASHDGDAGDAASGEEILAEGLASAAYLNLRINPAADGAPAAAGHFLARLASEPGVRVACYRDLVPSDGRTP
ncbi:MAG: polysaccharide deacetylase family protein [Planctomycetota bacterium]